MTEIKKNTRVGILVSGGGTTAREIIEAVTPGIEVGVVISSSSSSGWVANYAESYKESGIPTEVVIRSRFEEEKEFGVALLEILNKHNIDLVSQNGWLKKTPANVIDNYPGRIINQHPGPLDPSDEHRSDFGGSGMYGKRVNATVLGFYLTGDPEVQAFTESTIHHVTENFDKGDLIRTVKFKIDIPDSEYVETFDQLSENSAFLKAKTEKVAAGLLPKEYKNAITVIAMYALGNIPTGYKREDPLILPDDAWRIEPAKKLAKQLFPKG